MVSRGGGLGAELEREEEEGGGGRQWKMCCNSWDWREKITL